MANDVAIQNVPSAIKLAKATIVPQDAAFAPDIPAEPLACAINRFAKQAETEQVLAMVLAEKSGKSGFLFTDRALYFRKPLGHPYESYRFAYDTITCVKKTHQLLTLAANGRTVQWDLAGTLLWERSRRRVADVVVTLLQAVLNSERKSTEGTATVIEPASAVPIAADWPKVLAFHIPILVIGAPLMLLSYLLLANVGVFDADIARVFEHIGADRSLLFGALALLPSMYAFGTQLKFSVGRYVIAVIVLTVMGLRIAGNAAARGEDVVAFFPIGGGLIGTLLAFGLGNAGLRLLRLLRKSPRPD